MDTDYEDTDCSPTILESAKDTTVLPLKSKERYECTYNQFMNWRQEKAQSSFSESVLLAYFDELGSQIAPSSLWAQYSMLKSTISIHQNVDIAPYIKLRAFIKRKSVGYKPKKSKTLTPQEIHRFLNEAPDDEYLLVKVILLVGVSGACRKQELVQLTIDDMEDLGSAVLIKITDTKTKRHRSFAISGESYKIYKKYAALRPANTNERRFFMNYQNKKCTRQPIGKNKFANTPKQIASYLRLKEPKLYTGHCYRRSSASIFVDVGGDLTALKRYGGWRSTAVAEFEGGYGTEQRFDLNDPFPILLDRLQGRSSKVEEHKWTNDEISSNIFVEDISMVKTEIDDSSTPSSSSMFDSPEKNSESQIETDYCKPLQAFPESVNKAANVNNQFVPNVPQQSVIEPELLALQEFQRRRKRYSDLVRRNEKIKWTRKLKKLRLLKQQTILSVQKVELLKDNNDIARKRLDLLEEQNNILRTIVVHLVRHR